MISKAEQNRRRKAIEYSIALNRTLCQGHF